MIFVLLAPAQAFSAECATEAQRVKIETLNESVDWFLSELWAEVGDGIRR